MKSQILYIYGGGGHGRVVADVAKMAGYRNICFLDDTGSRKFDERLPKGDIIVAVGDNAVRERLCRKVAAVGFHLINLVHPSAVISPSVTLGIGVVVMPLAVINADARVGERRHHIPAKSRRRAKANRRRRHDDRARRARAALAVSRCEIFCRTRRVARTIELGRMQRNRVATLGRHA